MLERVIEEQAGGDAQKAQSIREVVQGVIGDNLKQSNPVLKSATTQRIFNRTKMWSQYLEVGIGTDAEILLKPCFSSCRHRTKYWYSPKV